MEAHLFVTETDCPVRNPAHRVFFFADPGCAGITAAAATSEAL
jgi:hypothetical protein